jgi:hypothetical protein
MEKKIKNNATTGPYKIGHKQQVTGNNMLEGSHILNRYI